MRPRPIGGGTLDECPRCGHLFRDLASCPARHRDLAYGGDAALDRIRLALTHRQIRRGYGAPGPASVFEIGFGAGALLRRFLDDGAAVAGCDPDQLGIDVDPVVRDRGHLVAGGIESLPRTEGEHDLVYGVHVLEHVDDVGTTLAAARGLLRPGGQVQMLTPAGDSDGLRFHGESWWMLEDPTHVRFFSEHSLRRAAEAAGLVDIEIRRSVLDSLSADAASLVRRVRPAPRPGGVLGSRPALALAAASAPAVALARTVRPGLRTTLHLLARAPQGR